MPLGDLIVLDQERCIQCARCIRFQDEIVGDSVLGFDDRGRGTQIITFSDPGFDSVFSGNTTDICPVGALTTTRLPLRARALGTGCAAFDLYAMSGGLQYHVEHAPRSQVPAAISSSSV